MMCKLAVYFMTHIACPYRGCTRTFALQGHLTKHVKSDTHQNGTLRQASSSSQAMAPDGWTILMIVCISQAFQIHSWSTTSIHF
ncbi:hypothetical protein GGU11DRAFT_712286 [Lentinula aff. detonsa]|nr:hypothetical protein GGU11DRAFT_712286 [Lentinula aff. detonsa]